MVPFHLGMKIPKEALERLSVNTASIISPGTMKAP